MTLLVSFILGSLIEGAHGGDLRADSPVVTVYTSQKSAEATGCWARLFSKATFEGKALTLVGELRLKTPALSDGISWRGRIRSVKVGPQATLVLFGKNNFQDRDHTIGPKGHARDLHQIPFGDKIESLKLICLNP